MQLGQQRRREILLLPKQNDAFRVNRRELKSLVIGMAHYKPISVSVYKLYAPL